MAKESNLEDLFDIQNSMPGMLEGDRSDYVEMNNDLWNKEKKYRYKVKLAEVKIDKVNHHEILEETFLENDPEDFMNFLAFCDLKDRKKFDNQIETLEVLYILEHNGIQYKFIRQTTKKILMFKGKELIIMFAGKWLPNGDYLSVSKSYEDKNFEKLPKWDRIFVLYSGVLFQKVGSPSVHLTDSQKELETSTMSDQIFKMTRYCMMNPSTKLALKVMKSGLSNYWKLHHKNVYNSHEKYVKDGKNDWSQEIAKF
jgi:hypothetical protein